MLDASLISASTAASFILTSLLIEVTPGPNMTYLALVSASEGRRAGFATVAGVALGLAIIGVIAAFGVTELVQTSQTLYEVLRWSGVLFLLYLAWDGWRSGGDGVVDDDSATEGKYFMRGLITNLLNPKAGIFYLAVLPTFMDLDQPPMTQAMTLTGLYVGVATFVHFLIVLAAGALRPLLNDPRREQIARRSLSALLALVALWFAWATAR
ncbi:LysE family translocator [Pseudaminobacter soli (ex Li et al. 2025)]|uniref:Lysine transporter LysE n=1 Tax=Pseudaminobacter soli (ex Li et al. 2025) TaxID=1295366 RepID=A0A2P7SK39_9HYPH|nr:LysE family translocator [Mesorhizobium soli]PSJ62731.1 lysine transporter LysE [Mesorhizobium soli]